jgi:hypothetical protein
MTGSAPIGTHALKNVPPGQQFRISFSPVQVGGVLAAINLNQFFKKGKHKYENQNGRESWSARRPL